MGPILCLVITTVLRPINRHVHSPPAVRKVGNRLDHSLDLSVRPRYRVRVFSLIRIANVWA